MISESSDARTSIPASPAVQAEGQRGKPAALVSIIIPCCGQLEYTRLCVTSLMRYTRKPFDLVFLDSGSLDGTADYLAGVAAAAPVRVEVIRTPADAAFAPSTSDANLRARGDLIALLGNDVIVTERWLDHLVALSELDAAVGMVAPMSNYAPPPQHVGLVAYRLNLKSGLPGTQATEAQCGLQAMEEVNRFARDWQGRHKRQWFKTDLLGGG